MRTLTGKGPGALKPAVARETEVGGADLGVTGAGIEFPVRLRTGGVTSL